MGRAMSLRRWAAVLVLSACPGVTARAAYGQSASDKAAAEALFREGRRLFDAGQYPEACAKLAESERLDPAPGTLLNLAGCYEKNGQSASAWATFKQAAAAARQKGRDDWEELARTRAGALEPRLSRLTITVAAASTEGLQVSRDGAAVGKAEWAAAIPVDPGAHVIDATAPARTAFHQSVDVPSGATRTTVTIPDLPVAPQERGEGPQPQADPGGAQRTLGVALGAAGVVGLAVGTVFGVVAMNKENEALHNDCTAGRYCSPQGLQLSQGAHDAATASTVAFGIGAAALAGGLVLYFVAPKRSAAAPAVGLRAEARQGGGSLGLVGSW